MGRACCVPKRYSGVRVPSHKFPKNPQKCAEWIKSLNLHFLKNYRANQLQRLKVCCKHFRETDYKNYYTKYRILLETAVPFAKQTQNSDGCNNIDMATNHFQSEQQHPLQQNKNNMEQQEQVVHKQNVPINEKRDEKREHFEKVQQNIIKILEEHKKLVEQRNEQERNVPINEKREHPEKVQQNIIKILEEHKKLVEQRNEQGRNVPINEKREHLEKVQQNIRKILEEHKKLVEQRNEQHAQLKNRLSEQILHNEQQQEAYVHVENIKEQNNSPQVQQLQDKCHPSDSQEQIAIKDPQNRLQKLEEHVGVIRTISVIRRTSVIRTTSKITLQTSEDLQEITGRLDLMPKESFCDTTVELRTYAPSFEKRRINLYELYDLS